MIYVFTALHCEAYAIIKKFSLARNNEITRFQVFTGEENEIILTITGAGIVSAATAVGSICTMYKAGRKDFLINVGTCAGFSSEGIYLCNKISEQSTGRTFYPDILYRHDFMEKSIITVAEPISHKNTAAAVQIMPDNDKLYDMEASSIYQAGTYFFAPHHMSFLKMVSDSGNADKVTPEQISSLMEKNIEKIAEYINNLIYIGKSENQRENIMNGEDTLFLEKLCEDMHCSKVMGDSLKQYVLYCILSGISYKPVIEQMYADGKLPCGSKREGKKYFEELKRQLL